MAAKSGHQRVEKPLASPIHGGGGPVDSGKARSRRGGGGAHFSKKSGLFRIFASQIFGLPPPFGHPPHKCGGQDGRPQLRPRYLFYFPKIVHHRKLWYNISVRFADNLNARLPLPIGSGPPRRNRIRRPPIPPGGLFVLSGSAAPGAGGVPLCVPENVLIIF